MNTEPLYEIPTNTELQEVISSMKNILMSILGDLDSNKYQYFREFCDLKEKGLRKKAFESLDIFISQVKSWDVQMQREYVSWLFSLIEISDNYHELLVHPLQEKLLKPILDSWINSGSDARPYRWYGLFLNTENNLNYLKEALKRGGNEEQRVLLAIINFKFNYLWYSFHHIAEDFYLGNYDEDQEAIVEIEKLIEDINEEHFRNEMKVDVEYYQNLLNDWKLFCETNNTGFVQWCAEKGRHYHWVKSFYYE